MSSKHQELPKKLEVLRTDLGTTCVIVEYALMQLGQCVHDRCKISYIIVKPLAFVKTCQFLHLWISQLSGIVY